MNLKKSVLLVSGLILFTSINASAGFGALLEQVQERRLIELQKKEAANKEAARLAEEKRLDDLKKAKEELQKRIAEEEKRAKEAADKLARENKNRSKNDEKISSRAGPIKSLQNLNQVAHKEIEADPKDAKYSKPHVRHGLRRKIASN